MPRANPLVLKLMRSGVLIEADSDALELITTEVHTYEREAVLVEQGERATRTPIIMSGMAYQFRMTRDGKRQILGLLLPGDCCDIQGPMLSVSDHGTATVCHSKIVWLTRETADSLTLTNSRIARAFWWASLVDQSILRSWLISTGQREASKSLAHFLCEYWLRFEVVGTIEDGSCDFPLRQNTLADVLGLTSVHVNRVLKTLRHRNLARVSGRRLFIPDIKALQGFCDFDASYLYLSAAGAGLARSAA